MRAGGGQTLSGVVFAVTTPNRARFAAKTTLLKYPQAIYKGVYRENDPHSTKTTFRVPGKRPSEFQFRGNSGVLIGRKRKLLYIGIFGPVLSAFTTKTTPRISDRHKFLGHFLSAFTAKTTLLKYPNRDIPGVYRENDPHCAKTTFRVPRKRHLP